ncbi:hypothetical protein L1887_16620 [Cichorium endivia]|nr:hypothetical protein L1887_16620 [Cichorium endivia]
MGRNRSYLWDRLEIAAEIKRDDQAFSGSSPRLYAVSGTKGPQLYPFGSGVRPFGVSLLVAGYDDKGPQLYQQALKY